MNVRSNSCRMVVGRLMEIDVANGYRSVEDVDWMIATMRERVATLPADARYVIAADWRNVVVMSPETAQRVHVMLTASNARVARSAILISKSTAIGQLQGARLVMEAENENRRCFTSPENYAAWLSEILTPAETHRLREFLGLTANSPTTRA